MIMISRRRKAKEVQSAFLTTTIEYEPNRFSPYCNDSLSQQRANTEQMGANREPIEVIKRPFGSQHVRDHTSPFAVRV
jgi:hypothetical protein